MDTHLESAKLGLCSWCTLPVPPLMQLVRSSHASRFYSNRVPLALLVPPLMQLVQSSHASSLYSTHKLLTRTTRTTVDAASRFYSTRVPLALLVPPLMQLVQSSHASSLYSTHKLLTRTTRTTVDAACAIFARLEPLLDPCAPGAHYSYHRWCSLCNDDSTHNVHVPRSTIL